VSAYRSPKTNAMLRRTSSGVAKRSLHMTGKAIDIRLSDMPTRSIRDAALRLARGGVGYYSRSNFVHLDTGNVRQWGA
ncbi:YcbK family protein, partial [Halochromatium sp.]